MKTPVAVHSDETRRAVSEHHILGFPQFPGHIQ
jgi:hypothetical protein